MCHITDPRAHYGAASSQLSEPRCLESRCDQEELAGRPGKVSCPPHIHSYWEERQNRKLTFGHCLKATPLSAAFESGDRASDLLPGNNDLFLCQGLGGLPRGARHLRRRVTVFGKGVGGGRSQHFDRPQKVKCVRQDARDFRLPCTCCQRLCVCVQNVTVRDSDSAERRKKKSVGKTVKTF